MAKIRISSLPSDTNLDINDEFIVNDNGITKRVSVSKLLDLDAPIDGDSIGLEADTVRDAIAELAIRTSSSSTDGGTF